VRARARAQLVDEIKQTARTQLAEAGAAALSLRAVARELDMVSSAIYRYFPSRDDLLTALIIDTYDTIGEVAERADAKAADAGPLDRWLAVCTALRRWAQRHVQEFALVFGTPVPGYRAPETTIQAATRVPNVFFAIVRSAITQHALEPTRPLLDERFTHGLERDFDGLREAIDLNVGDRQLARLLTAYTLLIGTISFELFGHLRNVVNDTDGWFDHQMRYAAAQIGIVA
jgi:AcrR family transcriptional regulator